MVIAAAGDGRRGEGRACRVVDIAVVVAIGVPGGDANGDGGNETGLKLRALMTVLEGCEC